MIVICLNSVTESRFAQKPTRPFGSECDTPASHWHVNAFTEILAPLRAPTYPYIVRLRAEVPPGSTPTTVNVSTSLGRLLT